MEDIKLFKVKKRKLKNTLNREFLELITLSCLILFSAIIGSNNYLLSHTIMECYIIIVTFSIGIIALNTYEMVPCNYYIFLGTAYAFLGVFLLLYEMTFMGKGIFTGNIKNLSLQFSLIARYIQGISFLLACRYFNKSIKPKRIFNIYLISTIILFLLIFYFKIFPICFVYGVGKTLFYITNQYILVVIIIAALAALISKRKYLNYNVFMLMFVAISAILMENILSTFFTYDQGIYAMGEHILQLFSCYLIYKAICLISFKDPYKFLFYELSGLNDELKLKNIKLNKINDELIYKDLERKKSEEALRESEERYRKLVQGLPDAVLVHKDNKVIFANIAAAKLIGLESPQQVIGKDIMGFVHQDYRDIAKESMGKTNEENYFTPRIEIKITKPDESEVEIESETTDLLYNGERAKLTVYRDISERKRGENSIVLLNDAIEYDKLKTEFFANISHELRTPLNVIFGALQLLDVYAEKKSVTEESIKTKKYIKVMKQNCYRQLRLVNNLIDITKIDSGYFQLNLENYNIVNVVEEITLSVADYIEQKFISIEFDTEIEEKIMSIDADKIERIMLNLLSNSIKFTNAGDYIYVNIYDKDKSVIISVRDTGIGIPEGKLELIFERFRQVDKSLLRNNEGSGIGLSLVKSLVELHGGKISIVSEYGKGSEFIIELPVNVLPEKEACFSANSENGNIETINIEFSDIYS